MPFWGGRFIAVSLQHCPVSVESQSRKFQIRGIDLEKAVAQEPHLQSVVERVNRALGLGRTQMAARMVQKELGHRNEATRDSRTAGTVAIGDSVVNAMKVQDFALMQAGRVSEVKMGACGSRRKDDSKRRKNDPVNTAEPN